MKKIQEQKNGSLLWRIIFGVVLFVFVLISLAKFNATAAFIYLLLSIFIFIPGRAFKINNKWIKIAIVIIAIIGVGLFNTFFFSSGIIVQEKTIGEEFILPGNNNFSLIITKAVEEYEIPTVETIYKTDGKFLLIYFKSKYVGNISTLSENNSTPFLMTFGLKDSNNMEYGLSTLNTSKLPQSKTLEKGEAFYLFNINKNATGLKFVLSEKTGKNFVVVDLGI